MSVRRGFRGGALLVVSLLLVASALLRIGVQAGTPSPRALPDEVAQESGIEAGGGQKVVVPADLQVLLATLRSREQQLNTRERQISDRMKALEIADRAIERKMAELVAAEERLAETLALADGASEGDLARLTDVYQKMKPKDAAALFEEMDPQFAAGFLGRMRPDAAAGIMAGLSPGAAYSVSVILAGRNALAPKE